MKKILSAVIFIISSTAGFSQEKKDSPVKPPAATEAAFKKSFPSAIDVKWTSESKDFEVSFKLAKKEMSAVYTAAGALKETETEIGVPELPAAVTAYVKQHYKSPIKAAAKITDDKGNITYEVESGEIELFFNKDGKFIKKEKEEGEEKE